MTNILLTPYDGAILGPIAKLLGSIMDAIYMFMYNTFGIENVGLTIIILTIIIYTLMLPLTFKQQKFTKLQQKIQPELKAIQDKYKNRKDQDSQMAMSNETQMLYDKYGINPMGSCLQMLVQMPIWLALYRVFYNVPAYVGTVKDKFIGIAEEIVQYDGFAEIMTKIQTDFAVNATVKPDFVVSDTNTIENVKNFVIDIIYKVPSIDSLITPNSDGEVYFKSLDSVSAIVNSGVEAFHEFNYFLGLNISDTPWNIMKSSFSQQNYVIALLAVAIPISYYFIQKLSLKLASVTNGNNKNSDPNDMMTRQMESMNKTMPIMMVFFCFITPVGLGIYWIVSSAYRSLQQVLLNKYFDNMDIEKIIEKNKEKAKKKQEKRGVYENQIREAAAMNTRSIQSKANIGNYADTESQLEEANRVKSNAKPGSLAAKANMVREYNERNSRK